MWSIPAHKNAVANAISAALKGVPAKGLNAALPHNKNAKHFVVRDPAGRIHRFRNASWWARENRALIEAYDDNPDCKTDITKRFTNGISDMNRLTKATCSWKGWTRVSQTEDEMGVDYLARNPRFVEEVKLLSEVE